jgi:nicotinamide-nucleotide amidase
MTSIILSIGDELVLGQTVDTNSAWLSQQLASIGIAVAAHITVPDDQKAIEQSILESVGRADALIITGGIGPTEDDLTRQALAAVMNAPLEPNQDWLTRLESYFTKLGRTMPPTNRIQAMIPRGVTMIDNTCGTAAGMDATYKSPDQKTICRIFVTPGVPKEMKAMFANHILPILQKESGGAVILSRTLHTFGQGESSIAEKLGALMKRDRNPSVGTTVANGVVSLRLNSRFPSKEEAQRELNATDQACRAALGDLIYGQDSDTLASSVANLLLNPQSEIRNPKTVSTAESCTGGFLSKMLTDLPGSSSYFTQGWITYSNQSKFERLGVPTEVINVYGAVSEHVATAMAANARRLAKSDFALSITGIAGPTGGSPSKPVGTVCIALASATSATNPSSPHSPVSTHNSSVQVRTFTFPGDRDFIRDRAAKMALTMLRFHLLNKPLPF